MPGRQTDLAAFWRSGFYGINDMETRANYALIGGFTLAVIVSIFLFILWFSGSNRPAHQVPLRVLFNGSISGLSRGGAVLFNGVKVGEVTHIDLAPDDPSRVQADVVIDARVPLRSDTKARLEFTNLTGIAALALTGGSSDAPPLPAAADGGPSVIRADRSDFQDLLESARRIATQASEFLDRANGLVDSNSASLGKTIKNAEKFSDALAANSDGIKDFMGSMADIGRTIKPLTGKLETLATDTDKVVKSIEPDRVKSILEHADSFSGKLDAAGNKIEGVMASLESFLGSGESKNALNDIKGSFSEVASAAKAVRRAADNINRFAGSGLRQYEALAVDGRKTLDTISQAVRSIENNPQQFLFGKKSSIPEYTSSR